MFTGWTKRERSNGKHSLIWSKRVYAAEEGVVFRAWSLKRCEQGVVLDRRQAVSDLCVWNLSRNELFCLKRGQGWTPWGQIKNLYPNYASLTLSPPPLWAKSVYNYIVFIQSSVNPNLYICNHLLTARHISQIICFFSYDFVEWLTCGLTDQLLAKTSKKCTKQQCYYTNVQLHLLRKQIVCCVNIVLLSTVEHNQKEP